MKAFMSTGETDQGDSAYSPTDASYLAVAAFDEARAILAETEPTNPTWSAHLTARGILPYRERRILAEALAAFVGEGC